MALVLLMMLGTTLSAESGHIKNKASSPTDKLRSTDKQIRDAGIDTILKDRELTVRALIQMVDPANAGRYSDKTRCAAAYLLGQFRAAEAANVLARALANPPGPRIITDSDRLDYPVTGALIRIGRPAVPALIRNIETTDNRMLRTRSLRILNLILGGKRRLLELLGKLEVQAKDERIRRLIRECAAYSRGHFKEDEEPLY